MKVTAKTGNVAGMRHVSDEDDILLITSKGMMIRTRAAEVRRTGRATQGVKLMGLEADDKVVAVAKLVEREEEEGEAGQPS
jgi:DNA gyrase subunit A